MDAQGLSLDECPACWLKPQYSFNSADVLTIKDYRESPMKDFSEQIEKELIGDWNGQTPMPDRIYFSSLLILGREAGLKLLGELDHRSKFIHAKEYANGRYIPMIFRAKI
ncbi:MAG: hypothetical protein H7318_17755 [Oligoflexus sp.]|nr:hypothetical protein [Oligoflexus sp.]